MYVWTYTYLHLHIYPYTGNGETQAATIRRKPSKKISEMENTEIKQTKSSNTIENENLFSTNLSLSPVLAGPLSPVLAGPSSPAVSEFNEKKGKDKSGISFFIWICKYLRV
jgi:hypothetical protein